MANNDWGKRYKCSKCGTRFYDLKKPKPICPHCGADQSKTRARSAAVKPSKPIIPEAPIADEPVDEPDEIEPAESEEDEILIDGA